MDPAPFVTFADRRKEIVEKTILALWKRGAIKEVYVVYGTAEELVMARDICSDLSSYGIRCYAMDFERAVDSITLFGEVILLPMGRASLSASVSYNLGRAGTNVVLASINPSGRVLLRSAKTLREIAKV